MNANPIWVKARSRRNEMIPVATKAVLAPQVRGTMALRAFVAGYHRGVKRKNPWKRGISKGVGGEKNPP